MRSISADENSARLQSLYTYEAREETRNLDSAGRVKSSRTAVYEILFLGGKRHRHLIEKDGRPLPPGEARREQQKLDRAVAEASRLTADERARREAETGQRRAKQRERLQYVPQAYNFTLLGETTLNGRVVYEIEATPRPDYRGKYGDLLRKMRGRFFIDKQDYHWVRVEAEVLDNISFGLFLARLAKGSVLAFETTRVNDEVWLPKRVTAKAAARLALLKKLNLEQEVTFSKYRKFQADSRITAVTEADSK